MQRTNNDTLPCPFHVLVKCLALCSSCRTRWDSVWFRYMGSYTANKNMYFYDPAFFSRSVFPITFEITLRFQIPQSILFIRLRGYHPPFTANPESLEYDPSPYPLSARRCFLRGKNVVAPCKSYWLYNSVSTRKPNLSSFFTTLER